MGLKIRTIINVDIIFFHIFFICHPCYNLVFLQWEMSKWYGNGQSWPLVFVGHGCGTLMLKQTLINLHSNFSENLLCNLCGIMFYGAILHLKTHSTNLKPIKHTNMLDSFQSIEVPLKLIIEVLLETYECFEATMDLNMHYKKSWLFWLRILIKKTPTWFFFPHVQLDQSANLDKLIWDKLFWLCLFGWFFLPGF